MKTFKQFSEETKPNFAQKVDRGAEIVKQAFHSAMQRPKMIGKVASTIAKPIVKTGVGVGHVAGAVAKSTASGISHGISNINKNIKQQAHDAAARQSKVPLERS